MNSACVFSLDDAYVMPFQVFFHSLERTESIPAGTPIFILHTDALSQGSIALLQAFLARYGREASFLDASHLIPTDLPIRDGDHVSPATFYRLFIAEILPEEIEQAVYFDADMLAVKSIADLFGLQVNGMVAAADHMSPLDEIRLWGSSGGDYFQAGILVIPIRGWRENNMSMKFQAAMSENYSRIRWWDQDVLNIVLKSAWHRLPIWANTCSEIVRLMPISVTRIKAKIIHFNGKSKPWNSYFPSAFTPHWDLSYHEAFGEPFTRKKLRSPLLSRLRKAIASRLTGLVGEHK